MYNKVENYLLPSTAKEACAFLAKPSVKAIVIGGSTHITKTMSSDINAIVDLRSMGLNYIKADAKFLKIGACVTFTQLMENKIVKEWAGGLLWHAAQKVTPQTVRNMGTIGGNVAAQFPYNSFPSVLLALDASVTYCEKGKTATCKYSELDKKGLFAKFGKKALILEILIPAATKKLSADFVKFTKPNSARECYAIISTVLNKKGALVSEAAVAVSSVTPKTFRLSALEEALKGQKLTEELIDKAIAETSACMKNVSDVYKKEVLPVLVKRSLLNAYNN